MKKLAMGGVIIRSGVGSYVPLLWDAGLFSMSSILLAGAGGILGIYLGFKLGKMMGG